MTDLDDVVVNGKRKKGLKESQVSKEFQGSKDSQGSKIDGDVDGLGDLDLGSGRTAGIMGGSAGRVAGYPVNRVGMRGDYRLTVNVEEPVVTKDSSKVKPKASRKSKTSFLYVGLMAAPDLSTVKMQHVDGVGTTFSLLLGYQFNKKWAIETGVSVDRKKYYTDAEYFDKKGMSGIPPSWDVTNLDGTCYMWEIPLNVRYNFSQTDKTSWFATAGLSTYFMTKESYNYQYYGSWGPGSSHWDVKKPSNYWFSIINLSAGYEHRIGNIGNLRIEPYLRIPMSGLGTGKLNILSGGLNIGITRRLW
ncbi:outer membrane beta-barrel protein [Puia sp. P3]|uniref:outer membrane beta-barrel protein n=1 Tax=Puia sp. P3 TaxID=3423952 RepID=UPI003D6750A9